MDEVGTVEVERKRELADDGSTLTSLLTELGWRTAAPTVEIDTYYSRADVDFMATVECLRVRRRAGFAEITYKPATTAATHSGDDVVAKVETNVRLADGQADLAERLLANLGMPELARVEKHRITHQHPDLPGVTVSIDTVSGVGTFIETEVNRPDAAGAAELIEQIEKQLGVFGNPTVALPYRDLVMRRMG